MIILSAGGPQGSAERFSVAFVSRAALVMWLFGEIKMRREKRLTFFLDVDAHGKPSRRLTDYARSFLVRERGDDKTLA